MNLFAEIRTLIIETLDAMVADGDLPSGLTYGNVAVEPPRDAAHGDMATNAAMVLAKPAGKPPRDIADGLAARLRSDPRVSVAEVAGPGFLNLTLHRDVWHSVVSEAIDAGPRYGHSGLGAGVKVNVEYVSANPTGPLHVGHTRGAVFGDALASLLAFAGYEVTREYYINDGGAQVDVLARSAYERYREACGHAPEIKEGLYPGDYLVPVGEAMREKYGEDLLDKGEQHWLAEVRELVTGAMMDMIREDLAALGVEMDVYFSEKGLYGSGRIEAAIGDLDSKGLIYRGTLEPPKGKTVVVGAGKASARMAEALEAAWEGPLEGLVITRYGHARPCAGIEIVEAAHPVPDQAGVDATRRMLALLDTCGEGDTVLALISGGGSALLCAPATGITLTEKQALTDALLASGAPIGRRRVAPL